MADNPTVKVTREGDRTVVSGGGEMDLTNCQEFATELEQAAKDAPGVVADLFDAVFVDTAVVQDLADAALAMRKRGVDQLTVRVKSGSYVERVIDILGFSQFMNVEHRSDSEEG